VFEICETNAYGWGLDTYETYSAEYNPDKHQIEFTTDVILSGYQHPDRGLLGIEIIEPDKLEEGYAILDELVGFCESNRTEEKVTSRERMLKALEGGKPDVVPIAPYFWGAEYTWKVAGVEIWELLYGDRELSFIANDKLYQRHQCDWIFVQGFGSGWLKGKKVEKNRDRVFITNDDGMRYEFLKDGHQLVRADIQREHVPNTGIIDKDIKTKADIDKLFGGPRQPPLRRDIKIPTDDWQKRLIDKYGETVFMVAGGISPFVQACYTLGFETSMIMMKEHPDTFIYLMDRHFENSLPHYERIAAYGYDAVLIAESWASVDIISPKQYEEFAFPYQKAAIDAAHAQGLKAILYSTGSLIPILKRTVHKKT